MIRKAASTFGVSSHPRRVYSLTTTEVPATSTVGGRFPEIVRGESELRNIRGAGLVRLRPVGNALGSEPCALEF